MKRAASWAAHAALSLYIYWIWLKDPGLECNWTAPITAIVRGDAQKPYIYRTLVPSLARHLMPLISPAARASLTAWSHSGRAVTTCFTDFKWKPQDAAEHLLVALLCYPFLIGFIVALRALFRALYQAPEHAVEVFSLLALACVQLFFVYCNYLYDFPTLLFFTLALLLLAQNRPGAYLAVFAVSLFNKETTILLAGVFALQLFDRLERRRWAAFLLAQLLLFAGSRLLLDHWYSGNPGRYTVWHFYDHNMTFAVVRLSPGTLAGLVMATVAVAGHWSQKPLILRRALLVILPPLVASAFLFGYFDELRDYYEAYPALLLLAAPTVAGWMGQSRWSEPRTEPGAARNLGRQEGGGSISFDM